MHPSFKRIPFDFWESLPLGLCAYALLLHFSCMLKAVFGLERIVELTLARKIPQVQYPATVAIRFSNNIVGELYRKLASNIVPSCGTHIWSQPHGDRTLSPLMLVAGGENFIDIARWAGVQ
jgi:hypothetical protein